MPDLVAQRILYIFVLGLARTGLIFTEARKDTAGQTDPNWPDRTGYSIPCAAMLGAGGGAGQGEGGPGLGARRAQGSESCSVHFAVCFVYSSYQYCCYCSLHLLLLLNCPDPDPRVFAFFFPFSSPPQQREGGQRDCTAAALALRCRPWPDCSNITELFLVQDSE